MMRILPTILIITMLAGFWSGCSMDEYETNENMFEVETRSNPHCGSCDSINVELLTGAQTDSCCTYMLNITSIGEPCRQIVEVDGVIIGFVTQSFQSFEINVCGKETKSINVWGYDEVKDDWTVSCFRDRISCRNCSCDVLPIIIEDLGATPKGCCKYLISSNPLYNAQNCNYRLVVDEESIDLSQISIYKTVEVCKEVHIQLYNGLELCFEDILNCACNGVDILVSSEGSPTDSKCCEYNVSVSNNSNCTIGVYDQNNILEFTVPQGIGTTHLVTVCPSNGFVQEFTVKCIGANEACDGFELLTTCFEGD